MNTLRHAVALALVGAATLAVADVQGILTLYDTREVRGLLRWQPVQKQYVVTTQSAQGVAITANVKGTDVASVRVAPPPGWEAIVRALRDGQAAQTVPKLEAIMKEYVMLQYDVVAGTYLAQIHMREKRAADALRVCEAVIASKPDAGTTSDLAPLYWEAMLATGKTAKLAPALEEAIRTAPRAVAARAHTLRGDLLKAENRTRDALKDGYLRTILMFRDVRAAQAEALYKAAVAFDELQQVQYAERMRQMLLSGYADSEYAKKLRGN